MLAAYPSSPGLYPLAASLCACVPVRCSPMLPSPPLFLQVGWEKPWVEQIIDRVMKGMLRTTEERAKAVVGTWGAVQGWRCALQGIPDAVHQRRGVGRMRAGYIQWSW